MKILEIALITDMHGKYLETRKTVSLYISQVYFYDQLADISVLNEEIIL